MSVIFWCVFADGRQNSISTVNLIEAKQRARALNAAKLFVKNFDNGTVAEVSF